MPTRSLSLHHPLRPSFVFYTVSPMHKKFLRASIVFMVLIGAVSHTQHVVFARSRGTAPAASARTRPPRPGRFLNVEFPATGRKNSPCRRDEARLSLKGQPNDVTCLDAYSYDSLKIDLQTAEQELVHEHKDIQDVLEAAQASVAGVPAKDPYARKTALFLKTVTAYADALCGADTAKPVLRVPASGIYDGFALTPTCSVSGKRQEGASVHLTVSFVDGDQERRVYGVPAFSFSGSSVPETGTGEHQVTCGYRPSFCRQPRMSAKTVTVAGPARVNAREHSVARLWNEVLLHAIAQDRVRPPVQARNLFHFGAMLHDIWTLQHPTEKPYLLNTALGGASCKLPAHLASSKAMEEAMSYAAFALIKERFTQSPGYAATVVEAQALMSASGYDPAFTGITDEDHRRAAALGNAVANCYIAYGLQDGSNEEGSYGNTYYAPRNPAIDPKSFGNPALTDWNHWQPIALEVFVDQGGNTVVGGASDFLAAEWGNVVPFSLRADQREDHARDGSTYPVYLDPGAPPTATGATADAYKWNFLLTGVWSSHLDPADGVRLDISPGALGDSAALPTTFTEMRDFYSLTAGGTKAQGRATNPVTHAPYAPQPALRGDYTRALAEYWADGPKSETPPGHWFSILNAVSDHPELRKRLWGEGPELPELEWDVKAYFTLGGAMHDAAIVAWGAKGYYDGIRPISAIRALADRGQSSDPSLPSYDPLGIPLVPGYVELVKAGDPLAGSGGSHVGQVKMRAWKGPPAIQDSTVDTAGTDWILAGNWWPYQRPSFVTPPFGGYISGHSTYSRAAAEVLTRLTGDAYFPGGLFEVPVRKDKLLVFERGPSTDLTLQWATYVDAADACSLSRIWGGIHPPVDDIAGRIAGKQVGVQAVEYAKTFFSAELHNSGRP